MHVIINMCFSLKTLARRLALHVFFLVAEKILVPVSVTCVIRLSLFVLLHNYLSMCS
jgi:hypothetical protein